MDLWIRSQDKKHLINCEALMLEQVGNGKWGIRAFSKNYDYDICNYKTKERALEVLDEIHKLIQSASNSSNVLFPTALCYEMPEE